MKMHSSPKIYKDFQILIPSRIRQKIELVISCKEVLKEKAHTMVYIMKHKKDKESVGSSYHVTTQNKNDVLSQIKIDVEMEDNFYYYHISINEMILKRRKMLEMPHHNLKKD